MADKTIIVKIEAIVSNLSSKLKEVTGGLDKFARSNNVLSKTFGILNTKQNETAKTLKSMTDGQKAVARGFLGLSDSAKTTATRYAKLDDAQKKLGDSYYKLSNAVRNGSQKAVGAQAAIINQWKAMPSHVRGAVTAFHNQNASVQQTIKGFSGLGQSMRSAITHFSSFSQKMKASNSGVLNFSKSLGSVAKGAVSFDKLKSGLGNVGKAIFSFSNATRTLTSASRAVGTSMIFAGGAFRQLGVGINVAASVLQSFLPALGGVVTGLGEAAAALGPYALLLAPIVAIVTTFVANLVIAVAQIGIAGAALYATAEAGIEFNRVMETTQISIATLTTQFKDLYDSQGLQIGAMKEYTDAQIMAMSEEERRATGLQQSVAVNEKLTASMMDAQSAFNTLTVEAAQSPFTTSQLASGFQAVVASLGQYNITTKQAAQLTVTLGRVASVAGVSAGALASQFTLFLTGAGRITSPLSRFASQVGLTKQKMMELREEFKKAKDDPEKSAAIMSVLTTRLAAFDEAGRRVATSWTGIMSNMTEAFELFAGSVTQGLFADIRDGLFSVKNIQTNAGQVIDIYDEAGVKIAEQFGEDADKMQAEFNKAAKEIPGSFAKVRTEVKGILSEIFNYDDKGALPTNIARIADVFSDKFQPLILIVEELFNVIGTDIAGALKSVTDLVSGAGDSFEDNLSYVLEIYDFLKNIGLIIWEFVKGLGQVFGVSGEISNTASTVKTVVAIIAASLGTIRIVLHVIMGIIHAIALIIKVVLLAVTATVDVLVQLAKFAYNLASGGWSYAVDQLMQGFTATKFMADSVVSSWNALANQGAGIVDTFNDVGKAGQRTGEALLTQKNRAKSLREETSKLKDEYVALAKQQKLYKDGPVVKSLQQGQKFVFDEKTKKTKVVDSKGRTVTESVTQVSVADAQKASTQEARRFSKSNKKTAENPIDSTKPRNLPDDENSKEQAKKNKAVQKQILETLFEENKKYAEKQIEVEQNRVERQAELVRGLFEVEKSSLEDALASNLIAYDSYYTQIAGLIELEKQTRLAEIETESNAIQKQHEINLKQSRQDELDAKAKYLKSKQEAGDVAEYYAELAKIQRKRDTEELEFNDKLAKQVSLRQKAEQDFVKSQLASIRERRDATIEFYNEIQKAQYDLNTARGGIDTASIKTELDNIASNYVASFRKANAQLLEANRLSALSAEGDKRVDTSATLEFYGKSLKQLTIDRVALEYERLDIATKLEEFSRQELERTKELTALDEARKYGALTTFEYEKRSAEQLSKTVSFLQEKVKTLIDLAAKATVIGDKQKELELTQQILDTQIQLNEAQNVSETILLRVNDELRSASKDFLGTILDDVNNIGDAFINLGKTIQKAFQKALIDRLFQLPAMERVFGNPQEAGKAGGIGGWLGRMMGIEPNAKQAANNQQVNFDITKQMQEAIAKYAGSASEYQNKAADTLQKQSDILSAIQDFFQKSIDNLTQTITGKTDITVTAATFTGVQVPNPVEPIVVNEQTGAQVTGSVPKSPNYNRNVIGNVAQGKLIAGLASQKGFSGNGLLALLANIARENGFNPAMHYDAENKQLNGGLISWQGKRLERLMGKSKKVPSLKQQMDFLAREFTSMTGYTPEEFSKLDRAKAFEIFGKYEAYNTSVVNGKPKYVGMGKNPIYDVDRNQTAASEVLSKGIMRPDGLAGGLMGSGVTQLGQTTPTVPISGNVTVDGISNQAAQTIANPQNTQTSTNQATQDTPLADNGDNLITNISTKVDAIAVAVSEGGALGLIKTAVMSIDTKLWSGLQPLLDAFLVRLQSDVVAPIVAAINTSATKELIKTTADNISTHISGEGATYAAYGGYISGPGGPTADKVPAWLSNGEYVIKAKAVKALGMDRLHQLNNADKGIPQFGFGGFVGNIFKSIGKFLKTDNGKLILGTVVPMLVQKFLPKGAKPYSGLISMGILGSFFGKGKEKQSPTSSPAADEYWGKTDPVKGWEFRNTGGAIGKFAGGGAVHNLFGGSLPSFGKGTSGGGGGGSANADAAMSGGISAALAIGMALIQRWQAKKAWKKQLEEYKKNRTKDPFGMNPDTLTFYKKPIITGSRNWLAKGGPITSSMMLKSMPSFSTGGLQSMDLEDIMKNAGVSDSPMTVNQNINITTPDVHSFRNSRGQLERDLARVTQRGLKRRAPKY